MARVLKGWRSGLILLAAIALFGLIVIRSGGPRYRGHSVQYYFPNWQPSSATAKTSAELEPAPIEAYPLLLEAVRQNGGHTRERLGKLFARLPESVQSHLPVPAPESENADEASRILCRAAARSKQGAEFLERHFAGLSESQRGLLLDQFLEDIFLRDHELESIGTALADHSSWLEVGEQAVVRLAASQLDSRSPGLRLSAATVLLQHKEQSAKFIPVLIQSVESSAGQLAQKEDLAVSSLVKLIALLGTRASNAVHALTAICSNGPPNLRLLAGIARRQVDPLGSPFDSFLRGRLASLDLDGAARLANLLNDWDLGSMFQDERWTPALEALLDPDILTSLPIVNPLDWDWRRDDKPTDNKIRRRILVAACGAAGRVRPKSSSLARCLSKLLADYDSPVRDAAIHALGEMKPVSPEIIPQIVLCLDLTPLTDTAMGLLSKGGAAATDALPRLREIARGENMPTTNMPNWISKAPEDLSILTIPIGAPRPAGLGKRSFIGYGLSRDYPEAHTRRMAQLTIESITGEDADVQMLFEPGFEAIPRRPPN